MTSREIFRFSDFNLEVSRASFYNLRGRTREYHKLPMFMCSRYLHEVAFCWKGTHQARQIFSNDLRLIHNQLFGMPRLRRKAVRVPTALSKFQHTIPCLAHMKERVGRRKRPSHQAWSCACANINATRTLYFSSEDRDRWYQMVEPRFRTFLRELHIQPSYHPLRFHNNAFTKFQSLCRLMRVLSATSLHQHGQK